MNFNIMEKNIKIFFSTIINSRSQSTLDKGVAGPFCGAKTSQGKFSVNY